MTMERSPSPPLPPDPRMRSKTVQPFQEPFIVAPSPSLQPQHQPVQLPDVKLSNTSRSRATSRPPLILHQPQPVREALHDAFEASPVAQNQLDPELVRQVTEQVIRNLQNTNVATPTSTAPVHPQQTQYAPPPPPPVQPVARSPTQSSTDSAPHRQYTPPSPEKRGPDAGYGSPSPERVLSEAASTYSRESLRSKTSVRSREIPVSMQTDAINGARRRTSTTARRKGDGVVDEERPRRRDSGSDSTARDQSQPNRRDSRGSESDYHEPPPRSRVRPPRVPSDVQETTTLEKIWQPLFDNGNPTVRLSQFLRGLALRLIDDYEPKGTLVVTPSKMLRFFNETRVPDERYPWGTIFSGKMTGASLSTMYRKLLCQHHLMQYQNHEVPSVPGLTPGGFEWFMTTLIQAHPDQEFERLARAVMDMPISNADNKSERFPKELSRRLLPEEGSLHAEQKIVASLAHEPLVQLRGASNMPPPPPPASAPSQQSAFTERERKPYSQTPFSNTVDDDDLAAPSFPLERERKPYTAKEGKGKSYGNENERERENRPPTTQYKPIEAPPPKIRSSRSNSGLPTQSTYNTNSGQSSGSTEPMNIPLRSHRQSMGQGPPPAMLNNMNSGMNGSLPKGRRTPPPRNPYARSEPLDINGIPPSQYTSNLHPGYPPSNTREPITSEPEDDGHVRRNHRRRNSINRDFRDRSTNNGSSGKDDDMANGRGYPIPPRRRNSIDRDRPATRGIPNNDDEGVNGRGYPIPPRPPPSSQAFAADTGYNSTANVPPVGSYPRSGGFMSSADARRSTWYGGNGVGPGAAGGGTDGYGSFAANGGGGYPSQQTYGSSVQH